PILKEQVNYVNARLVADSRGVDVAVSIEEKANNYTTLIKVKVHAKGHVYEYAGTIFGIDEPRIVEIAGYNFDFAPTEHMVLAINEDKPGIIGRCGISL
ncbi:MAG: phosphoglycerate dehydrogenase, partial [Clostridiales bacterium]